MKKLAATQLDSYKIGHKDQYPEGTTLVYSNFTARSGKLSNVVNSKGIFFVGLQYFIIDYLIDEWNDSFFSKNKNEVVGNYSNLVKTFSPNVDCSHIEKLHDLGYLPLQIKALPEGSFIPYGVPVLTVKNTMPEFYWLTNMIESVMSSELWLPITSATTYAEYHKTSLFFSNLTCDNNDFVPFQNHDFSMRGMQGRYASAISSFAPLAIGGRGTDCVPAIELANEYYSDDCFIGGSVPATEHSVMCAGGETDEKLTLKRLITDIYPSGNVAAVCDSWDFWRVVTEYLPLLKPEITGRDGKLVIRPDSGCPVKIICGDNDSDVICENKGLIECLWDIFGGHINTKGYKVLDSHIGAIYGDSITLDRQKTILSKLEKKGFASNNVVFGVGSYSYAYVTRDTHGMAMKSTYAEINGKGISIFKSPKTDVDKIKQSAKGLLMVVKEGDVYSLVDSVDKKQENKGCLETVFLDGKLIKKLSISDIRKTAAQYL